MDSKEYSGVWAMKKEVRSLATSWYLVHGGTSRPLWPLNLSSFLARVQI